jgi:hypothetical protein
MVVLVRCTDKSVSVALASKLELLVAEGLITAYLGSNGWVEAKSKKPLCKRCSSSAGKSRCTASVSCF